MGFLGNLSSRSPARLRVLPCAAGNGPKGSGIAVQEAKRAGAIVIASAVGALPELIRHGADGYLHQGSHSSAAAHVASRILVAALADDPGRAARIRRRAEATPGIGTWRPARGRHTGRSLTQRRQPTRKSPRSSTCRTGGIARPDGAYVPGADVYAWSPVEERLGIPPPRSVVIGGYYGHQNLGDEAVLAGLLDEWQTAAPDTVPVVLSGDRNARPRRHECSRDRRAGHRRCLRRHLPQ
jgi:hypothetical protein